MKLNADLNKSARVRSEDVPWSPSPLPGVARRMLERDGGEVARVTSIVRYGPGRYFDRHVHSGGEEYFVLRGTFSDESGDYPAGFYVRNPVGSSHRPYSEQGCIILVKLHWMHADDQEPVHINTRDVHLWRETEWPGIQQMPLHAFKDEVTFLYQFDVGATLPERSLPGGEEFFVLSGDVHDHNEIYEQGAWRRLPIGRAPELHSKLGCILLYKEGHLSDPPQGPAHD